MEKFNLHKTLLLVLLVLLVLIVPVCGQKARFKQVGQLAVAVSGPKAIVKDSLIFLLGGSTTDPYHGIKNIQEYNAAKNTCRTRVERLVCGRTDFFAAKVGDSIIYLGGTDTPQGEFRFSMELWDLRNPPFIKTYNPNFNRIFGSGILYKKKIYLIGGKPSRNDTADFHYLTEYDTQSNSVTYYYDSIFVRPNYLTAQMSVLVDSSIYIFGGLRQDWLFIPVIMRFDIFNKKFTVYPNGMAGAKVFGGVAYLGNKKVMVIGGQNEASNALSSTEIYDFSGTIPRVEAGPQLLTPRSHMGVAVLGRSIYVFGGSNGYENPLSSVERLDSIIVTDAVEYERPDISDFSLSDNYPNPFNPSTKFSFGLNHSADVSIEIFSMLGTRVKVLASGSYRAGVHTLDWDGTDSEYRTVPSGVYLYRVTADGFTKSKKMVLLR